jgi:hypothetical protein
MHGILRINKVRLITRHREEVGMDRGEDGSITICITDLIMGASQLMDGDVNL